MFQLECCYFGMTWPSNYGTHVFVFNVIITSRWSPIGPLALWDKDGSVHKYQPANFVVSILCGASANSADMCWNLSTLKSNLASPEMLHQCRVTINLLLLLKFHCQSQWRPVPVLVEGSFVRLDVMCGNCVCSSHDKYHLNTHRLNLRYGVE